MTSETPRVRTSDAERERIAEVLRAAVGEGRLTLEEGDERLATLYTTKYRDELAPLVADLPSADAGRRPGRNRGRTAADEVWTPESRPDTDENGEPLGEPGHPGNGPWGGPGWYGPGPAPYRGAPGWQRMPGPRPCFGFPLIPLLFLFLVFGLVGGIVHGHFFAFLPLVLIGLAVFRIFGFRRRWGGWRR
jgi:hypothetical protein